MAKQYYQWVLSDVKEEVKNIQSTHPAVQPRILIIMSDRPLLHYSLVQSGLATDPQKNPFLTGQPQTSIRFKLADDTGLEEHDRRIELGNIISLGDYDNDTFVDVLIPGQGLWHNLGGGAKFKRVDKELHADVDGTGSAFADVNNDGLADIIIVGPSAFHVSLQDKDHTFGAA